MVGLAAMLVAAIAVTIGFVVSLLLTVRAVTGEWLRFASTGQDLFTNDLANLFALLGSLAILLPLVLVVVQLTLGILTVLTSVNIRVARWNEFEWMAQGHQFTALLLLLSLAFAAFLLQKRSYK